MLLKVLCSGVLFAALLGGVSQSALAYSSHAQLNQTTTAQVSLQQQSKGTDEAESTMSGEYLIVALGDSISAGYEPGMNEESIPYGFVERLQEQGWFHSRARAVNYGILGLTSEGLRNYVEAAKNGASVTPDDIQKEIVDPRITIFASRTSEVKTSIEQADLITITIGGNDLMDLLPHISTLDPDELKTKGKNILTTYESNVRDVIEDLLALNPNAQIVLTDQYQPVPKAYGAATYEPLQNVADLFTTAVDGIVSDYSNQGYKVKAAHVAEAFRGRETSLTHIFPKKDIHPNQSGYEEIAKIMANVVWGSYTGTLPKTSEQPISIVIKGTELQSQYPPILKNNQTFVVLKDITTAIGGTSRWNNLSHTAIITYEDRTVEIPIGSKVIVANGVSLTTATPAFLGKVGKESKTYVPLALLVEGLGLDVKYSSKMKTVFINQ